MSTQLWLRFTEHDLLDFVCRVFVPLKPVHTQRLAIGSRRVLCVLVSHLCSTSITEHVSFVSKGALRLAPRLSEWDVSSALARAVASWQESGWCLRVFLLP